MYKGGQFDVRLMGRMYLCWVSGANNPLCDRLFYRVYLQGRGILKKPLIKHFEWVQRHIDRKEA